jgi:hypothetical protein
MPRYIVMKKSRRRSGGINRNLYLEDTAKSVQSLIKNHKQCGDFITGSYVAFRVLKDGKLSRAGTPFEH